MEDHPTSETEVRTQVRRHFSDAYKRRILKEYEALTIRGQKGALLRREGLYDSQISAWRQQMAGQKPKRGRPRKLSLIHI